MILTLHENGSYVDSSEIIGEANSVPAIIASEVVPAQVDIAAEPASVKFSNMGTSSSALSASIPSNDGLFGSLVVGTFQMWMT